MSLVARRKDRLDSLAVIIREQNGRGFVVESDITDEQQANGAIERTVAELGRIDTLVNCAGVMLLGQVLSAPLAEWTQTDTCDLLPSGGHPPGVSK